MTDQSTDLEREKVQSPIRWGLIVVGLVALLLVAAAVAVIGGLTESSRIKITLSGHTNLVTGISWSPDGKRLASSSLDNTVRVWDVSSGQVTATLQYDGLVSSVAWSPNGKRLAAGSQAVQLWDAESGNPMASLTGPGGPIQSVAWSPDSNRVAAAAGTGVWVWDAASGKVTASFTNLRGKVNKVAWSPDNKHLAAASNESNVHEWDADIGGDATVYPLSTSGAQLNALGIAYSPDGKSLAVGVDIGEVYVMPAAHTSARITLGSHSGGVTSVAWSHSGRYLASGSNDNSVKVWDMFTQRNTQTFTGPFWSANPVTDVTWSPNDATLAVATKSEIRVWSPYLSGQPAPSAPP